MNYHIIPDNDLYQHTQDIGCMCNPVIDSECEEVIIHNAFDGRDITEIRSAIA